jgi:aspartyl-tRNA(Asn)/glutamyl-tRNA(Gln) amidotransferase subunit A
VTEEHLGRLERDALNAIRTVARVRALARAREVDAQVARGEDPGPLAGVPVAVKENIEVAGVPYGAGSPLRSGVIGERDAPVVEGLQRAGAVLVATAHMSEWALGGTTQNHHYGPARNPVDPERTPGGSSGGSGAAVGAGLVPIALGTDTGGSVRIPAALCGVVGLRPTAAAVSNVRTVPAAASFDMVGPLARDARDAALAFDAIAGADTAARLEDDVAGLLVGVLGNTWRGEPLEAATAAALDGAATDLEGLGLRVAPAALDGHHEAHVAVGDLLLAEAGAFHADRLAQRPGAFGPDVLARLRHGAAVDARRRRDAEAIGRAFAARVDAALGEHDVLLAPACPFPAPRIADSEPLAMTALLTRFTSCWALAGVPALAVPVGRVDGLPVAMQLIGRRGDDGLLLRVAHAFGRR